MNDSRLTILTQMAREVEELELAAAEPMKLAPRAPVTDRSRVLATLGPIAALAACIAIAGAVVMWPGGQASAPNSSYQPPVPVTALPPPTRPSTDVPLPPKVQPVADESAIVLAIVEDTEGDVQCVSWTRHDPSTTSGHALTPADLARQVCRADCIPGPHWLVAAKVSGPSRLLPNRDEEVQALAQCIMGEHADRCDGGPTVLATGSVQCLPAGMRVVVERRSLASP